MPSALTYPGVYIEEIPSGVRTITGVATSITAFIGRTLRGPTNDPGRITSFADFERRYGGLHKNYPLTYAVRDFYLNGGTDAIIVRLFHPHASANIVDQWLVEAKTAKDDIESALAGQISSAYNTAPGPTPLEKEANSVLKASTNSYDYTIVQINTAIVTTLEQWEQDTATALAQAKQTKEVATKKKTDVNAKKATAALAVTAAQGAVDAAGGAVTAAQTAALDKAKTDQINVNAEETLAIAEEAAANTAETVAKTDTDNYAKAKEKYVKTIQITPAPADLLSLLTNFWNIDIPAERKQAANILAGYASVNIGGNLTIRANEPGVWGNVYTIHITHTPLRDQTTAERFGAKLSDFFRIDVLDATKNNAIVETIINLTIVSDSVRRLDDVLSRESSLITAELGTNAIMPIEGEFPLQGGDDGDFLQPNDFQGSLDQKTGIYALEDADLFNLMCIPPDQFGEDTDSGVYSDALNYCNKRRAMLIVDPPKDWGSIPQKLLDNPATALGKLNLSDIKARNAAIYYPRVKEADPLRENRVSTYAACGIIAGVMARTDVTRGIWKAPAGTDATISGVRGLDVKLTEGQIGVLNPYGINCLRIRPPYGTLIWGARTMRGADEIADEYKYVPVRRMLLFLEESLYRGTQWVVFEPNDEPLWAQIRLNIGAFMNNLFRQGAFQGSSPREAYFVRCDKTTTTQNDINLGIVNIIVGFAPLKPAEFVILKFQQIAGQIQT